MNVDTEKKKICLDFCNPNPFFLSLSGTTVLKGIDDVTVLARNNPREGRKGGREGQGQGQGERGRRGR